LGRISIRPSISRLICHRQSAAEAFMAERIINSAGRTRIKAPRIQLNWDVSYINPVLS
jgi:hypothetical protein